MLVEQQRNVGLGDAAIPDVVGDDQQAGPSQAALHAASGDHLDAGEQALADLVTQRVEHLRRTPVQARPLWVARRALVEANEDVFLWLGQLLGAPRCPVLLG